MPKEYNAPSWIPNAAEGATRPVCLLRFQCTGEPISRDSNEMPEVPYRDSPRYMKYPLKSLGKSKGFTAMEIRLGFEKSSTKVFNQSRKETGTS